MKTANTLAVRMSNTQKKSRHYKWNTVNLAVLQSRATRNPEAAKRMIANALTPGATSWRGRLMIAQIDLDDFPVMCDTCHKLYPLMESDFTDWTKVAHDDVCPTCNKGEEMNETHATDEQMQTIDVVRGALKDRYRWADVDLVELQQTARTNPHEARKRIVSALIGREKGLIFQALMRRVKLAKHNIVCDRCRKLAPLMESDFTDWTKAGQDDLCGDCSV